MKLQTPVFRVSFPHVFKPNTIGDGTPKYEVVMLFNVADLKKDPKELAKFKAMQAALKTVAQDKWGDKVAKMTLSMPFKKGEEKEYDGYGEGIIYAPARSKDQPGVVDQSVQAIINPGDFYAGCYARASINVYAWEFQHLKKGCSFGLNNIQKVKDGKPLGTGKADPSTEFDAIADDFADEDLFEKSSSDADDLI